MQSTDILEQRVFVCNKFYKVRIVAGDADEDKGTSVVRTTWEKEEKKALFLFFDKEMKNLSAPSKAKCSEFIDKYHGVIQPTRTWKSIQYYVKYMVKKMKKDLIKQ